ncbi:uncharacterized protein EAE98_001734 [Botrytis deweyae]|uniref:Uncharacterized protein n=1 Tax=Botrytis deweyae TaxID=2478750 RepID=A0ABQ7IYQ2_9HELO|nr:uncharacterized protein EAE98_001734 [Botrytis deweyae]KAF7937420.1 hypothetical protein EAE98_001734 [Botrytis deweyae]
MTWEDLANDERENQHQSVKATIGYFRYDRKYGRPRHWRWMRNIGHSSRPTDSQFDPSAVENRNIKTMRKPAISIQCIRMVSHEFIELVMNVSTVPSPSERSEAGPRKDVSKFEDYKNRKIGSHSHTSQRLQGVIMKNSTCNFEANRGLLSVVSQYHIYPPMDTTGAG